MARRHLTITVAITVDEDALREHESDIDADVWPAYRDVLRTALHHVTLDNTPEDFDLDVVVTARDTGITYEEQA